MQKDTTPTKLETNINPKQIVKTGCTFGNPYVCRIIPQLSRRVDTMLLTYLAVIYSCIGSVYLDYIYYKNLDRKCLPYYDCPPGHEILPCSENFQRDICHKCNKGYKQPDLISSSERNKTSCFKPTSTCLAHELIVRKQYYYVELTVRNQCYYEELTVRKHCYYVELIVRKQYYYVELIVRNQCYYVELTVRKQYYYVELTVRKQCYFVELTFTLRKPCYYVELTVRKQCYFVEFTVRKQCYYVELIVRKQCYFVELTVRKQCYYVELTLKVRKQCYLVELWLRKQYYYVELTVRKQCYLVELTVRNQCYNVELTVRKQCYFGELAVRKQCYFVELIGHKTLTDSGECVPCPANTYKNDTGCGPCRRISKRTSVVIHSTQQPLLSERSTLVYASISPQYLMKSKNNDDHILIPVIVVLCVIFVFLLVAISFYCVRKPGIGFAGICWSHDNTEQQNRQDRNNTQTAALIRTPTDEDNVTVIIQTALPTDKQTRLYPNLQAINGDTQNAALTDAGSTESGFHEESDENISTSDPLIHELCSHTEIDSKCEGCQNKRNTLNIDQHDNDDCSYKTKKEQPFQDFATGNHFKDDFCFSSSLSPVVTETEPHTGSSFPKTRKSFALNIPDTTKSYPLASGEYIPMNKSALDGGSTSNDSIVSDLEYYNHEIRGTYNSCKSYGGKSETKPKLSGPNSLDSGVFGSEKNECQ
ncbi:unnamed protein product [Mytilus edulis]|uniref:Uncharacterized protein n=1 Tax=Mytilus edulis TaxID=6550 RepID=A0A8S3TX79_MYTED|nr:unnamed protein product [Mytilus edulis]